GGDEGAHNPLLREARGPSALYHPNIAVITAIKERATEGRRRRLIAIEDAPGQTLSQFVRAHPLDVQEAVALVRQVAEALAEAHDRGVVHRDVKSSNVMVTESGRVKVLDFGLAQYSPRVDDTASTWSRAPQDAAGHALVGTVAYMSPEQARGREVDGRTD